MGAHAGARQSPPTRPPDARCSAPDQACLSSGSRQGAALQASRGLLHTAQKLYGMSSLCKIPTLATWEQV